MAVEAVTPGDITAPPAEPAAPAAPSEPASGSEPDINPSPAEPSMVPSDRLREETEKRRQAEERIAELEAAQTPTPQITDDLDDIDPDSAEIVRKVAKKLGLVSREDLAVEQSKVQVQQDVNDLTANPPNPGIPYDNKAVMDYAKTNNLPITSKAALKAAYREMNYDKIVEAERQKAIEGYKTAGASGAEQPGSSGAVAPQEPQITGRNPKERAKERIRLARQKLA